jgi:outer membrane protein assembly factor BamA
VRLVILARTIPVTALPRYALLYNAPVGRRLASYFLVFCLAVLAQGTSAKTKLSYKLLSIHVKGLGHYTEDEVIRASGLRLDSETTEADFKKAVQKLGDTGLFTEVEYSYQYSDVGCDLEFKLTENDKLVPVLFDNFVWFSDDELISALRSRIPLFEGKVPLSGSLPDQVNDALSAILASRKIAGQVEYEPTAALNGPVTSYTYTVKFHPVLIRSMKFPGASPQELPALQAAAKALAGQEYLRSAMRPHESLDFLPVYLAGGYLKARFADSQAKVVQDGAQTFVDVSFPVTPGEQYKTTQLVLTGVSVFPEAEIRAAIHQKIGDPANAVQLQEDLQEIERKYGTKGYLMAQVIADPIIDDANATVSYRLNVNEGDLFRMGDLQIDGIDAEAARKLAAQWQIKRGDPYDNSYLRRFFRNMYHDVGLSRAYSVVPKELVDRQQRTVTVALHFVVKD